MVMNNPYEKAWESIGKALSAQSNMILWIAERTLSAKDFKEFVDEFAKASKKENISMSEIIGVGETCAE
jgi:hypothetical protein